jgi:uncharacterized protein
MRQRSLYVQRADAASAPQRIAVVGSGIAGLASAWLLSQRHEVTLFEANDYLGGHTHTHDLVVAGQRVRVDTGFIVYNPAHYPLLSRLFAELELRSQPTTMSLSVRNEASGLEYNATTLASLFCQRRNLVSPRFLGMIRDLLRFNREARALLEGEEPGPTLGEYLRAPRFGAAFRDEHIVPMASAIWSAPPHEILNFPARYLVQFMANHELLQTGNRVPWRVLEGGSASYVEALRARWRLTERLSCPVLEARRTGDEVLIRSAAGTERFDHAVFACHSDQTLSMLLDASPVEREVLGDLEFQPNRVLLHTDASLLPKNPRAWAAWNALIPKTPGLPCSVSYWMNRLQGIRSSEPLIVTLNPTRPIDPRKVLRELNYAHPVYRHASCAARARKADIQGRHRSWFAGAYWGWGFHEDGMRSAVEVAEALGAPWQGFARRLDAHRILTTRELIT